MARKSTLTVCIDPGLLAALKTRARRRGCSTAVEVALLLQQAVAVVRRKARARRPSMALDRETRVAYEAQPLIASDLVQDLSGWDPANELASIRRARRPAPGEEQRWPRNPPKPGGVTAHERSRGSVRRVRVRKTTSPAR